LTKDLGRKTYGLIIDIAESMYNVPVCVIV